jgi:hypothetical protein
MTRIAGGKPDGRSLGTEEFQDANGIPRDYLTIGQLARETGYSLAEITRFLRMGRIKVGMISSGARALRLFHVSVVDGLREMRIKQEAKGALKRPAVTADEPTIVASFSKEEAERVFRALREEKTPLDIALSEPDIHPEIIRQITLLYAQMDGALLIQRAELKRINEVVSKVPFTGTFPIRTAEHVLELVEVFVDRRTCVRCLSNPRSFCDTCFKRHAREAYEAGQKKGADEQIARSKTISAPEPPAEDPPPPTAPPASSSPYTVARTTRASRRAPA